MTLTTRETNLAVRLVRGAALKPDDSGKLSARKAEYFEPDRRAPLASYEGEVPREGARVTRNSQFAGRRKQAGCVEGSRGLRHG